MYVECFLYMYNVRVIFNFFDLVFRDVNFFILGNLDIFFFLCLYELVCILNVFLNNLWVCFFFEGFIVLRNFDG